MLPRSLPGRQHTRTARTQNAIAITLEDGLLLSHEKARDDEQVYLIER